MLNEDYRDMLRALNDEGVRYLLVGAYALAAHGIPRATMDIDLWVQPASDNADATLRALERFGAPLQDLTRDDLLAPDTVFQIGVAPRRIELMTAASGLEFDEAFARSMVIEIDGLHVHVLSRHDLIRNKRSTGRTRDLADVEALEEAGDSPDPPG